VDVTVHEWLIAYGQSPRLITLLWEPLALAALNQPVRVAAATTFVEVLSRMFGPDAESAALVVPAVPLDELYAEPARAWLASRGSEVRTGVRARVHVEDGRAAGVAAAGEVIRAPIVIAATPWFALGSLFDVAPPPLADLLERAAATNPSPIVTVNLWLDRAVLGDLLVGFPGRVFQWAFDKGAAFGRDRSHVSLVSSGASDLVARDNRSLVELAYAELGTAIPDAGRARLIHGNTVRERRATFSLAPGQPARPGTETALPGLLLAGDWIDTGLPATIESAVISGHRAARLAR
jgi:hypothetical protein